MFYYYGQALSVPYRIFPCLKIGSFHCHYHDVILPSLAASLYRCLSSLVRDYHSLAIYFTTSVTLMPGFYRII